MSSLDNVMFMVSTPVQRALTLHSESGRSVIHGRTMKPCFSDSGISDLSSTCPDVTLGRSVKPCFSDSGIYSILELFPGVILIIS